MKYVISFATIIAFCLTFPLTVSAAETNFYDFEIMPSVSMLDDYDFESSNICTAMYEGHLPEGLYNIFLLDNGSLLAKYEIPVSVTYDSVFLEWENFAIFNITLNNDLFGGTYVFNIGNSLDWEGFTPLLIFDVENHEVRFDDGIVVRFVSVDTSNSPNSDSSFFDTKVLVSGFATGLFIGVVASLINKFISAFVQWTMS